MMSFLGRVRLCTCNPPIRHFQHVLDSTRRPGLATIRRNLTTSTRSRPTASDFHASMAPHFLGRILGWGRRSKSTSCDAQPDGAASPIRLIVPDCKSDDPKMWEAAEQNWEREAAENSPEFQAFLRESMLVQPLFVLRANFPEEDGFQYHSEPFHRDISYTETQDGNEVTVTIPREDARLLLVARPSGNPQARVNGFRQGGFVCVALTVLPPPLASSEPGKDADSPFSRVVRGMSDAASEAAEQALLEAIELMQDQGYAGSAPVENQWVEGCMAVVCMGGKMGAFVYSKEKGLHDPPGGVDWAVTTADEKLRRQLGAPIRSHHRPAADSSSKTADSQFRAQPKPGHPPEHETLSDVPTPLEAAPGHSENRGAGNTNVPADDPEDEFPFSLDLWEKALKVPLAIFEGLWPVEDGYEHWEVGFLDRDIKYTDQLGEGGEKVAVTIPFLNTHLALVFDPKEVRVQCVALYVLPPGPAAKMELKDVETSSSWGRDMSVATRVAAAGELKDALETLRDIGYNTTPPLGERLAPCQVMAIVGLEVAYGLYTKEEGVRWTGWGPLAPDGCGLAAALDLSTYSRFRLGTEHQ